MNGPLPKTMVMLLLSDLTLGVKESVSSDLCDCDKVQASQTFIIELFKHGDSPLRWIAVGLHWKKGLWKVQLTNHSACPW